MDFRCKNNNFVKKLNECEQKMRNKIIKNILVIGLLFFASLSISIVLAADTDSAAGTVTVGNANPTIESVKYVDSAYSVVTNFDPDNTNIWGINVTVGDANTLADLKNVTFYFFDDSVHSSDWSTASPTGNDLITASWVESTDVWSINQGSFTEWTLQTPQDPGTASSLTTYDFTFRFDMSRATFAETDFNATVRVYDDVDAVNTTAASSFVQVNNYFELAWSVSTFAWGSVTASSTNNTMLANRTISFFANTQWELLTNGSDLTAGGETDVDLETVNAVIWDENGVEGGTDNFWLRNTQAIGTGTWDNQARMTSETQLTRDLHFWFTDTGDLTINVEYDITIWVQVRANT